LQIKDRRLLTRKVADVSVRETKNNSVIHFAVDILKLLLSKRTALNWPKKMTKIRSVFQLNLAIWKEGILFSHKEMLF